MQLVKTRSKIIFVCELRLFANWTNLSVGMDFGWVTCLVLPFLFCVTRLNKWSWLDAWIDGWVDDGQTSWYAWSSLSRNGAAATGQKYVHIQGTEWVTWASPRTFLEWTTRFLARCHSAKRGTLVKNLRLERNVRFTRAPFCTGDRWETEG